jgi:signal transduction histidine kinase
MFTSLKIDLSRLQSDCPLEEQEKGCAMALREDVDAMNQQIAAAMDFVRRISSELRPGVLDKLGLTAALEWLARETEERSDLVVQIEADHVDSTLDELISVTLFRIAQEALTNVVRHAQARMVEIHLTTTAEEIVLEIRDDGEGIPMDSISSNESLGIIGMRERVMLINGRLSIRGVSGQGTTVSVTISQQPALEVTHAHSAG